MPRKHIMHDVQNETHYGDKRLNPDFRIFYNYNNQIFIFNTSFINTLKLGENLLFWLTKKNIYF